MRRLLGAFGTIIGIWLIASVVFAVVAHIDSASPLIYSLGALIVVPIPIMLVLIFLIMRHALASEPIGMAPTGGPVDPAVVAAVTRAFPAEDRAAAIATLSAYGAGPDEPERTRIQQAIVRLSRGDLDRLGYFTDQAKAAYRDVLTWDDETPTRDEA